MVQEVVVVAEAFWAVRSWVKRVARVVLRWVVLWLFVRARVRAAICGLLVVLFGGVVMVGVGARGRRARGDCALLYSCQESEVSGLGLGDSVSAGGEGSSSTRLDFDVLVFLSEGLGGRSYEFRVGSRRSSSVNSGLMGRWRAGGFHFGGQASFRSVLVDDIDPSREVFGEVFGVGRMGFGSKKLGIDRVLLRRQ